MTLGGWINPHRDPDQQVGFLEAENAHADFALSQVVSHHSVPEVEGTLERLERGGAGKPVVFGVFFYRSANEKTLETLSKFFPVPAAELQAEFESGKSAEEICARSIRELRAVGAEKVYVSNLGERGAGRTLRRILDAV